MNEIIYTIQPCANGYLVVLPQHVLKADLALMEMQEKLQSGLPVELPSQSRVHVFTNLDEAISFLKLHLEGQLK